MELIVTTIQHPSSQQEALAGNFARRLHSRFIPRGKDSLPKLATKYATDKILVVTSSGPVIHTPGGEYFFHLSMAHLRIKNIITGKDDHMTTAMGLTPGMSVLDCTLGLASDAIVASYVAGAGGQVVGLEAAPPIALIAEYGLQNFNSDTPAMNDALRRITVLTADYNEYLAQQPSKSVDVVYFDPMFRHPVYASSNLKPLRYLADDRELSRTAVDEACRVARRRVIIKEKNGSSEFTRLGITTFCGGKHSNITYGVIDTGGDT